ncbi:unnamed protein product [Urochloa humidicola]
MDDLREAGLGDAQHRGAPAPGTAAARARRSSSPQRLGAGDLRGARPPPPHPPRRRRGDGGGAARHAGEAGDGARVARRVGVEGGAGKVEEAGGGTSRGTSRDGGAVGARAGPGRAEAEAGAAGGNAGAADVPAGGGAARVRAVVVAPPREGSGGGKAGDKTRASASSAAQPREGSGGGKAGNKTRAFNASAASPRDGSGGGEVETMKRPFASSPVVGSKKRVFASSSTAPPPKRRLVSAEPHFPPGSGRGADGGSRLVTTAPARPGGGSAASPTKPDAVAAAARHPPRSVGKTGSGGVRKKASAEAGDSRDVAAPARRGGASVAKPAAAAARHPPSVGKAGSSGVLEKAPAAVDGSRLVLTPAQHAGTSPTKHAAAAARRPPSVAKAGSGRVLEKASAAVDSSRLVVAPARRGGSHAASPTKPAAAPHRSVGEAGSAGVLKKVSAAVVPRPVADGGGCHGPHAAALKSLEPSRRSGVAAAAGGLLDTDSQGRSGRGGFRGGFRGGKEAVRFVPKPEVISATRRFTPGRGRVMVSQPLKYAEKCHETESEDSSTSSDSFGPKKKVAVKDPDLLRLKHASACKMGTISTVDDLVDSILADDAFLRAEAAYRKLNGSSDARSKFKMICGRFHFICEAIVQFVQQRSQPLKYAEKCHETESEDSSTSSDSFGPKKKVAVKDPDLLRLKHASACKMGTISTVDDLVDSILADDAFLRAEAAYRKLNGSSDARSKFKMICGRFHFICEAIVQFVQQRSLKISRIDTAADKVMKQLPGFTQQGAVIGDVPGVEVGDEFLYRVQLALVGLHRLPRKGIDYTRDENNVPVAISIVASGRYPDELSSSGELIYTGSGGKYAGKKSDENQKLEGDNLALKNCIQTKTPVRVIHGFKCREEGSHSKAKGASAFTYDGLYHVVHCWKEGQAGSKVFKYKLLRIPGQPELPHRSKTASGRKTGIMRWR